MQDVTKDTWSKMLKLSAGSFICLSRKRTSWISSQYIRGRSLKRDQSTLVINSIVV